MSGLDNFIDNIIDGLSDGYMVRKFIVKTEQDIFNAIDWGQIIFLEWANQSAVIATNYERIKDKKVVLRLHRYEAFTDFPKQINWQNVNCLILVASHMITVLKNYIPDIEKKVKIEVVYNGLDSDKIPFKERKAGFDIAWVGYINYRKNPAIALQILKKLVNIDKQYKLHIAGSFQDKCLEVYMAYMIKELNLQDNIIFYGWIDDMESFWKDKNYLLHVSVHEAHSYAIMEAMAKGIKPVIANFRGAKELYPKNLIFNTIDVAADEIMNGEYYSKMYRNWVIDKGWTLQNQLEKIRKVIEEI